MHERASRARRPIGRLPLRSRALAILHEFMASKRPDASTLWRQIAFQRFFSVPATSPVLRHFYVKSNYIPTIVCLIGRVGDARVCLFCIFPDSIRLGKWNIFLFMSIFFSYLFFFFFYFTSRAVYYAKKNARISAMHIEII